MISISIMTLKVLGAVMDQFMLVGRHSYLRLLVSNCTYRGVYKLIFIVEILYNAWKAVPGIPFVKDGSAGKAGIVWFPTTINPETMNRSFAAIGHYENVKSRKNYILLSENKVDKIGFSDDHRLLSANRVFITPRFGAGPTREIKANKEVILAAGSIHSPQILQRSGVGPKVLLESANIEVVRELPGVGQNFQDHSYVPIKYKCKITRRY
jgi:choline dehydrogenase